MTRRKRVALISVAIAIAVVIVVGAFYIYVSSSGVLPLRSWTVAAPVTIVAFSPNGELLGIGMKGGRIELRKVRDGSVVHILGGGTGDISSLAFSPDGKLLASGTKDGKSPVYLWQVSDASEYARLGQNYPALTAAFSPDGRLLATGSSFSQVGVWLVNEKRLLTTLDGPPSYRPGSLAIQAVAFSNDGSTLAACNQDEGMRTWRLPDMKEVRTEFGPIRNTTSNILSAAAFSSDAETIATSYYDISGILVWDLDNVAKNKQLPGQFGDVWSMAFSPDIRLLATAGGHSTTDSIPSFLLGQDYSMHVVQLADPRDQRVLVGHTNSVRSVAWSPDGGLLASGSDDSTVRLWQVK